MITSKLNWRNERFKRRNLFPEFKAEGESIRIRSMKNTCYILQPSSFGTVGIVWKTGDTEPTICRIFLPSPHLPAEECIRASYPGIPSQSCRPISAIAERILRFLEGENISFELDAIALDRCSTFQQRVLCTEAEIPRGFVSTYGRIAKQLGCPQGARVVGTALAQNPFPILIPCHRAILSDGALGGFQGGCEMKRALLVQEGIEFSPSGKVVMNKVYY